MILKEITREVLYKMPTDELIELYGQLGIIQEKIQAELLCRGEF